MKDITKNNITWILNNISKIPEKYWTKAENDRIVFWLLDREDGTAGSYETSQEKFGITLSGELIWGFSSGCSCWSGWNESDYQKSISYKEFILKNIITYNPTNENYYSIKSGAELAFAEGWENEVNNKINQIKGETQ